MWDPGDLVSDLSGRCLWDPHFVAAIVVKRGAEVPAVYCMDIIAASFGRSFMDKNFHAGWCNGSTGIVERAIDVCKSR